MNQFVASHQRDIPLVEKLSDGVHRMTGYWWTLLVAGVAWVVAALVILQFNDASVTTVGVLVGLMFLALGAENMLLSTLDLPARWAWTLFGALFLGSAVVCFADPTDTFAGLAEALGFLFLVVGSGGWCAAFWSGRSIRSGGSVSSPES